MLPFEAEVIRVWCKKIFANFLWTVAHNDTRKKEMRGQSDPEIFLSLYLLCYNHKQLRYLHITAYSKLQHEVWHKLSERNKFQYGKSSECCATTNSLLERQAGIGKVVQLFNTCSIPRSFLWKKCMNNLFMINQRNSATPINAVPKSRMNGSSTQTLNCCTCMNVSQNFAKVP